MQSLSDPSNVLHDPADYVVARQIAHAFNAPIARIDADCGAGQARGCRLVRHSLRAPRRIFRQKSGDTLHSEEREQLRSEIGALKWPLRAAVHHKFQDSEINSLPVSSSQLLDFAG